MTPLEPIPETAQAAAELARTAEEDLLAQLTRCADRAREIVPDLVGVSIARLAEQLTFTLVATAPEIAVLDAVQYVAGGPCVEGAEVDEPRAFSADQVLDEEQWRLFAAATSAQTVRSTLTLPVLHEGVSGSINLYAASDHAFVGHHEQLAEIFGAWAGGAVTNADLSFRTRAEAEQAPARIREQVTIDVAVGILVADQQVDPATASERLRAAASRAGVSVVELARMVVRAVEGGPEQGDEEGGDGEDTP